MFIILILCMHKYQKIDSCRFKNNIPPCAWNDFKTGIKYPSHFLDFLILWYKQSKTQQKQKKL